MKIVCFLLVALFQRTVLQRTKILRVAAVALKTVALREHHWVVPITLVSVQAETNSLREGLLLCSRSRLSPSPHLYQLSDRGFPTLRLTL